MNETTKIYKFSYRYGKIVIDELAVERETKQTYLINNSYPRRISKDYIGVLREKFFPEMYLTEKNRNKFVGALKAFYNEKIQKKESELKAIKETYQIIKGLN